MDVSHSFAYEVREDKGTPVGFGDSPEDGGGDVAKDGPKLIHEILIEGNVFEPGMNRIAQKQLPNFLRAKNQVEQSSVNRCVLACTRY